MLRKPWNALQIATHYNLCCAFRIGIQNLIAFGENEGLAQEFLERIAALIPIPYLNLIRYNGVFAPASPLRSKIVKTSKKQGTITPKDWRIEWSELLKRTFEVDVTSCICGGHVPLFALLKFAFVNEASTHRLQTNPPFT